MPRPFLSHTFFSDPEALPGGMGSDQFDRRIIALRLNSFRQIFRSVYLLFFMSFDYYLSNEKRLKVLTYTENPVFPTCELFVKSKKMIKTPPPPHKRLPYGIENWISTWLLTLQIKLPLYLLNKNIGSSLPNEPLNGHFFNPITGGSLNIPLRKGGCDAILHHPRYLSNYKS